MNEEWKIRSSEPHAATHKISLTQIVNSMEESIFLHFYILLSFILQNSNRVQMSYFLKNQEQIIYMI